MRGGLIAAAALGGPGRSRCGGGAGVGRARRPAARRRRAGPRVLDHERGAGPGVCLPDGRMPRSRKPTPRRSSGSPRRGAAPASSCTASGPTRRRLRPTSPPSPTELRAGVPGARRPRRRAGPAVRADARPGGVRPRRLPAGSPTAGGSTTPTPTSADAARRRPRPRSPTPSPRSSPGSPSRRPARRRSGASSSRRRTGLPTPR